MDQMSMVQVLHLQAYLIAGSQTVVSDVSYANDVYMSSNQGQSWTMMTLQANWIPRDAVFTHTVYSHALQKDIISLIGGHATAATQCSPVGLTNEVWVSSDSGVNWTLLTLALFLPRNHGTMATQVSAAGVIVIFGGKLSETVTLYANDVWPH